MNAILQQLFMVPAFRRGLMEQMASVTPEESILMELRRLVCSLKAREPVDAAAFCALSKNDKGGIGIDPCASCDAFEFMEDVLSQLSDGVHGKNLVDRIFTCASACG